MNRVEHPYIPDSECEKCTLYPYEVDKTHLLLNDCNEALHLMIPTEQGEHDNVTSD